MSDFTSSQNMSLPIPVVGTTPGPDWATLLDSCMTVLDGHSHVPGSGVPITPAAINVNQDLTMGGFNLTNARSLRFTAQSAALALASDVGCLYEAGVDLYYNDGNGNHIRLTQAGSIVGTAGSITGLPSGTASAAYNGVSASYVWQSATGIAANMDAGSLILRNLSPNSTYGVTLQAPANLAINYALTLPALPLQTNIMSLDTTGAMAALINVDNSTIVLSSNTLQVPTSGIATAQIADSAVTTAKIADGNVTPAKMAAVPFISVAFGASPTPGVPTTVATASITTTSTARPITITLGYGAVSVPVNQAMGVQLLRDGVQIAFQQFGTAGTITAAAGSVINFPMGLTYVEAPGAVTVGPHTYTVVVQLSAGSGAVGGTLTAMQL